MLLAINAVTIQPENQASVPLLPWAKPKNHSGILLAMPNPGFNSTQIKQLNGLFQKNSSSLEKKLTQKIETANLQLMKQITTGVADVVESLSQTIKESEDRTTSALRSEFKSEFKKLDEKLANYVATTPTKYQVARLETTVFGQPT
jgi:hypothetical protein